MTMHWAAEYASLARRGAIVRLRPVDLPELLAEAMIRFGFDTEEQLARHLGITQGGLSKWMNRTRIPRRSSWEKMSVDLGVPYQTLVAAIGQTGLVNSPSLREQLRECQAQLKETRERCDELEREALELRARLGDST